MVVALDYYNKRTTCRFPIRLRAQHDRLGGKDNELKAFENMLDKYPTGVVAWEEVTTFSKLAVNCGVRCPETVSWRDGRLVVRPDSGDPKR